MHKEEHIKNKVFSGSINCPGSSYEPKNCSKTTLVTYGEDTTTTSGDGISSGENTTTTATGQDGSSGEYTTTVEGDASSSDEVPTTAIGGGSSATEVTTTLNESSSGEVITTATGNGSSSGEVTTTVMGNGSTAMVTPDDHCRCGEQLPSQMRLVTEEGDPRCGATLISAQHVLTAANCLLNFDNDSLIQVKLTLPSGIGETLDILKITRHPLFNDSSYENDLAILTLKKALKNNFQLDPVCLPSTYSKNGTALVTGTKQKFQTDVTVTSNDECQSFWKIGHISDSNLCAWIKKKKRSQAHTRNWRDHNCHYFDSAGDTITVQKHER